MMAKEKTSRARPASLAYEEEDGTQREGRASTEADTGVNPRGPTTVIQGISNAERRNAESDEGASNAKDKQSKSCMPGSAKLQQKKRAVIVTLAGRDEFNGEYTVSGKGNGAFKFSVGDSTIHRLLAKEGSSDPRRQKPMWVIGTKYKSLVYWSHGVNKEEPFLPPETNGDVCWKAVTAQGGDDGTLPTVKIQEPDDMNCLEQCMKGTACYQNVLKRYHMSFEHIAMIVWIRKTWLHLIWINLMVTIFIISCYAFAGGSWVYPCEGNGCTNFLVQVDKIWTCGPFVHCRSGVCQYYDDVLPPYPMWQAAWFFFVVSLICIPIGLALGFADLLYQVLLDNAILKPNPVSVRRLRLWHTFMNRWAQRLGRDATILSAVSMCFGLLCFAGGFGSTGDKSPPAYPCGICGDASGPFSLDNCTAGGDSMGALGAFVCLVAAALAAYIARDRRVWEDAARKLMAEEDDKAAKAAADLDGEIEKGVAPSAGQPTTTGNFSRVSQPGVANAARARPLTLAPAPAARLTAATAAQRQPRRPFPAAAGRPTTAPAGQPPIFAAPAATVLRVRQQSQAGSAAATSLRRQNTSTTHV